MIASGRYGETASVWTQHQGQPDSRGFFRAAPVRKQVRAASDDPSAPLRDCRNTLRRSGKLCAGGRPRRVGGAPAPIAGSITFQPRYTVLAISGPPIPSKTPARIGAGSSVLLQHSLHRLPVLQQHTHTYTRVDT